MFRILLLILFLGCSSRTATLEWNVVDNQVKGVVDCYECENVMVEMLATYEVDGGEVDEYTYFLAYPDREFYQCVKPDWAGIHLKIK